MNEMNNIIQTLNNWTKAYDEGHPEVSDKEWDELYFKLKERGNRRVEGRTEECNR